MTACVLSGSLLGAAVPGVPMAVHQRAEQLAQACVIQTTTEVQRRGNHCKSNVRSNEEMASLLAFGYVNPNYGWAPKNMKWCRKGNGWALVPQGV